MLIEFTNLIADQREEHFLALSMYHFEALGAEEFALSNFWRLDDVRGEKLAASLIRGWRRMTDLTGVATLNDEANGQQKNGQN